jgi:4-hydroxybenzoyl-CoA thioesterase
MRKPHVYEHLVRFRDCDPAGIVFYGHFYEWFDDALWAMMRQIAADGGFELGGSLFPLANVETNFSDAVRWNELLRLETTVAEIGRASFAVRHRAFVGDVEKAVCVEKRVHCVRGPDGRIAGRPIPDALRASMEQRLEG